MILEALAVSAGVGALTLAAAHLHRRRRATAGRIKMDTSAGVRAPSGLRVGDVLLHDDTEYWLAGALHLDEDGLVLRAFHCPGGAHSTWVLQLDDTGDDLGLCTPTGAVPDGHVPDALPVGDFTYTLRRRGRARVSVEGSDVPRGSNHARYNVLRGPGGRVLVVLDLEDATRIALVGSRLERDRLDLLPGGGLDAR